ncbi:MAG TPA: nucleoside deaminase [Candidatus Omnitrophota bacterium]|nr:nucleoside deaminase [Candidatus Omnitrophota bacterium]HQQ05527.1 nucleoside deaminase [Candidatus Omnitrophota bacterium]
MSDTNGVKFMALAVREARRNLISLEGGPFGACIVKNGRVVSVGRNTVLKDDASCHAEINAIRAASRKLGTYDLSGCRIYSTTEPCPMCFSAIHWARIGRVIYGTTIADARRIGFNELAISARAMKRAGKSPVRITAGFRRAECRALFDDWLRLPGRKVY